MHQLLMDSIVRCAHLRPSFLLCLRTARVQSLRLHPTRLISSTPTTRTKEIRKPEGFEFGLRAPASTQSRRPGVFGWALLILPGVSFALGVWQVRFLELMLSLILQEN